MTTLLQISDTHFGTEQPAVVAALEAHVREHGADVLILSGDITQRARREQFAAAKTFVERLESYGIPRTLVIPGNHDLPLYNVFARFLTPYGNYRRHFGQDLEPSFENDELLQVHAPPQRALQKAGGGDPAARSVRRARGPRSARGAVP